MFHFVQLDPRKPVFPLVPTLGIEVSVSALADKCGLGNIDPQHGCGRNTPAHVQQDGAAIEAAMHWPLPPAGAALATTRPDLDSIGAMAVLALRAEGHVFSRETLDRIAAIAVADCFAGGKWAPRPLPTPVAPWPNGAASLSDTPSLAHVASICSPMGDQPRHAFGRRVAVVAAWLIGGDEPTNEQCDLAAIAAVTIARDHGIVGTGEIGAAMRAILAEARRDVDARRVDMALAVADGRITITLPTGETVRAVDGEDGGDFDRPAYAIVRGSHAGALAVGYCVAPVVVATHPSFTWDSGVTTPKTTIAFFDPPGIKTITALRDRLNRLECATRAEHTALAWSSAGWADGPFDRALMGCSRACRASEVPDLSELRRLVAELPSEPDALSEETRETLAILESGGGWGGNLTSGILGSPLGRRSSLSEEEIVEIVEIVRAAI